MKDMKSGNYAVKRMSLRIILFLGRRKLKNIQKKFKNYKIRKKSLQALFIWKAN